MPVRGDPLTASVAMAQGRRLEDESAFAFAGLSRPALGARSRSR